MVRRLTGLLIAVTILVGTAPSANAWTAQQHRKVYKNKVTNQPIIHHHSTKPVQMVAGRHPAWCRSTYESITLVDAVGLHVWSYVISAHFCYNGQRVTYVKWNPPSGTTAFWSNWDWVQADSYLQALGGGVGEHYIYHREAGHFSICLFWYCTNRHPWVSLTLRGDGTSPGDGGLG